MLESRVGYAAKFCAVERVSANRVKQLLVSLGNVAEGLADNIAGHDAALAALAGYTQGGVNLAQRIGAFLDGGANLGVSDALAETNVHSA